MAGRQVAEVRGDLDPAALLHELTKHGWVAGDRSRLVDFRRLDPANRPAPFKRYRGLPTRPLPVDLGTSAVPAAAVLSGRGEPAAVGVDAASLAALLFFSAGVTRTSGPPDHRTYFRAAMSAGNLHPLELYVVSGDLPGVPAGVHHFAPLDFGLTALRPGDWRPVLGAAAADPAVAAAPATVVVTGIPWRTAWKYGERGWRHLYWDAGTLLANLLATAAARGLPARVLLGFVDSEVGRLVGVDGVEEFPLALVVIGAESSREPPGEPPGPVEPLDLEVLPISARPITLPLLTEAQRAGALPDAPAVATWRSAAGNGAARAVEPATGAVEVPGSAGRLPVEEVVLRRGSTRLMRRETVPAEVLSWGMAVASRPVPGDLAPEDATSIQHWLSVHGVVGVEPGTARWRAGRLEPGRRGDFRASSEHLCLDQPLGGDSAYTVFHCAELAPLLGALGPRGYRAAQLEAGVAAGRLALAAFTLGHGATGLTFFDDEVARFFDTPAACLLVTSVGVPAYRSTPGGRPGAATELGGFDRLMGRLTVELRRPRR